MADLLKVTVFEAINLSRREIFVGATKLAMSELMANFGAVAPPEVSHWLPGEPVDYRSLEFDMDPAAADAFIRNYAATQADWRVITARRIGGS
jgi:hypothetical protein